MPERKEGARETCKIGEGNVQECQDTSEKFNGDDGQFWSGSWATPGLCIEPVPLQYCV